MNHEMPFKLVTHDNLRKYYTASFLGLTWGEMSRKLDILDWTENIHILIEFSTHRRGLTIFSWGGGRSDVMFTRLPTFLFNKKFETNVIFMYDQNVAFNFHFEI